MKKNSESDLGGEPLVICTTCEAVVPTNNAEAHWVSLEGEPTRVWICKSCMRLGRGDQVWKYVMKKEKEPVGR